MEVVGRATHEALKRLISRGVLSEPESTVRTLYVSGRGLAQPRLAPDSEKARVLELRRRAEMACRRARQLVASLSFDAARQPLEESVVLLARAYAMRRRLAEPQDVRQAVSETFTGLWGDTLQVIRQLLTSDGSPVAVARALGTKFGA